MELILHSPVGAKPVVYTWPLTSGKDKHDVLPAIVETMRWACEDLPELKLLLENDILCDYDPESYESMKILCDRFNRTIDLVVALENRSLPDRLQNKNATKGLLRHILQQTYNQAVTHPKKLNQYKPFSPEVAISHLVYGEVSVDFVDNLLELLQITSDDIFIDLGSGVGQVVLQMAAATPCKLAIGIEKAEVPNRYAEDMDKHFRAWMQWYGKIFGEYELIKGDFLNEELRGKITSATVVFVNNLAFGPAVDHQLKERFADLKNGTRIVSVKSFSSLDFRISNRNLNDIGTIMNVYQIPPMTASVSWTGKPISYYLHIIDHAKLERYFQKRSENKAITDDDEDDPTSRSTRGSRDLHNKCYDKNVSARVSSYRSTICHAGYDVCCREDKTNESKVETRLKKRCRQKKITCRICCGIAETGQKQVPANPQTKSKSEIIKKAIARQLPPAPERVDQQLPALGSDNINDELTIPQSTVNALQILLDAFKEEYLSIIDQMQKPGFKDIVIAQIKEEKDRNQRLKKRAAKLDNQINTLINEGVSLTEARLSELGISPVNLSETAKQILERNLELLDIASQLQIEIKKLAQKQDSNIKQSEKEIAEKYVPCRENSTKQSTILREKSNTLSHGDKSNNQVPPQNELVSLQKLDDELKQAQASLVARQQQSVFRNTRSYSTHTETLAQNTIEADLKVEASKQSANSTEMTQQMNNRIQSTGQINLRPIVRNIMAPPLRPPKRAKLNFVIQRTRLTPLITKIEDHLKTSVPNEDQQNKQLYSCGTNNEYTAGQYEGTATPYNMTYRQHNENMMDVQDISQRHNVYILPRPKRFDAEPRTDGFQSSNKRKHL